MLLHQAGGGDLLVPRRFRTAPQRARDDQSAARDQDAAELAQSGPAVGGAAEGVHAHDAVGAAVRQSGALQLPNV